MGIPTKKNEKTIVRNTLKRKDSLDQISIVNPPLLILKRIGCLPFPLTKVLWESVLVQVNKGRFTEKPPKKYLHKHLSYICQR